MVAMVEGLKKRGLNTTVDAVSENFDELVRAAGKEPGEVTARQAMRLVNQRDPAFAQALVRNTAKRWAPIRQGQSVDPREADLLKLNSEMLDDVAAGKQSRFNVRGEQGGRPQLRASELEPPTNPGGSAKPLYTPDDAMSTLTEEKATVDALGRLKERAPDVNYAGIRAHYEGGAKGAQAGAGTVKLPVEEEFMPGAERAGREAAQRLQSINAGKKRFDQVLGGVGAASVIPGVNKVTAPIAGAMGTLKTLGSDKLAGAARATERFGAEMASPEAIAKSWLKNPSLLAPLAQKPGKLGEGARWALEALEAAPGDAKGFKSRLFILTMQPWFRAEVAQGQSDEASPEQ
jgi:hypothetical protein